MASKSPLLALIDELEDHDHIDESTAQHWRNMVRAAYTGASDVAGRLGMSVSELLDAPREAIHCKAKNKHDYPFDGSLEVIWSTSSTHYCKETCKQCGRVRFGHYLKRNLRHVGSYQYPKFDSPLGEDAHNIAPSEYAVVARYIGLGAQIQEAKRKNSGKRRLAAVR